MIRSAGKRVADLAVALAYLAAVYVTVPSPADRRPVQHELRQWGHTMEAQTHAIKAQWAADRAEGAADRAERARSSAWWAVWMLVGVDLITLGGVIAAWPK